MFKYSFLHIENILDLLKLDIIVLHLKLSRELDVKVLKEWVISITQSFWDEFKIFTDLNVSFKNKDSRLKITK